MSIHHWFIAIGHISAYQWFIMIRHTLTWIIDYDWSQCNISMIYGDWSQINILVIHCDWSQFNISVIHCDWSQFNMSEIHWQGPVPTQHTAAVTPSRGVLSIRGWSCRGAVCPRSQSNTVSQPLFARISLPLLFQTSGKTQIKLINTRKYKYISYEILYEWNDTHSEWNVNLKWESSISM